MNEASGIRSRRRNITGDKGASACTIITSKKESGKPNAIPSSQSSPSNAAASAIKASAPAAFVEKDFAIPSTHSNNITSAKEIIQPDAIPSESSINGSSSSTRKQESGEVKHQDIRPCSISSSSSSIAVAPNTNQSSPHDADANNSNKREKKKMVMTAPPVAFVEKDFIEGEGESRPTPLPETITSGDTSTGPRADQKTTKEKCNDNKNNDGVAIKNEDSLTADNNTNSNQQKRRNQGSRITPIKSAEFDNNDDAYPCAGTRRSRRKRKQYPSEEESTNSNDNHQTNKKKRNKEPLGGKHAVDNNTNRRTSPRNKKHKQEEEGGEDKEEEDQEEDQKDATIRNNTDSSDYSNDKNETSCCGFCLNLHWKNKIYYKCGTVISKYFPKSNNNPNPGWYKGTIRVHHVSSSPSSNPGAGSEWEEETKSSEEENEKQFIILNEIHYEDGDMENITQDDLKLQLVDGGRVKILHSTKIATTSNSERHNRVDVVPQPTLSDNKFDRDWLRQYHRLQQFNDENGTCRVPQNHGPDPSLGTWVSAQRQDRKKGKMAPDRVKKLNKIGFDWDPFDQTWDELFGRLEQFKSENGHCRVPAKYDQDPSLGIWVSTQRGYYKKGNLAGDRAEKLNEIGFDWDTFDQTWQEKYDRLKRFKAQNGNCRVPRRYGPDPSLGRWVGHQRRFCKQGKLAEDRKKKLNKIGFEWVLVAETTDQVWQEKYDRLK